MSRHRQDLLAYFGLVYAVTWSAFILAAASSGSFTLGVPVPAALKWPLLLLGAFAPSAVATWLTARRGGRDAVRALLRRLLEWRVGAQWFAFALLFLVTLKLAAALIVRLTSGTWPAFGSFPPWYQVLVVSLLAMVLGGPLGEEVGWRGYALPRLQSLLGERAASVMLGALWALWHWPVFFIPGLDQYGQPFIPYALYVTGLSVAFAWLYRNTRGSLLLAVVMHTAVNQTKDVVVTRLPAGGPGALSLAYTPVGWAFLGLIWACAGWMLSRMPAGGAERV